RAANIRRWTAARNRRCAQLEYDWPIGQESVDSRSTSWPGVRREIGQELPKAGPLTLVWHPIEDSRMAQVEQKLAALGIALPTPAAPIANYVGFVRTGSLLVVSGQICLGAGGTLVAKGKLGDNVTVEQGQAAARACAINLIAQIKVALGDLDKMVRVVRLGGF